MKRFILLFLIAFLITGCANVNKSSLDALIDEVVKSDREIYNTYRTGYKFYLPSGMYVKNSKEYNEEIRTKDYSFYLYIDLISYLNKTKHDYEESDNSYFSRAIETSEKFGYVEINQKDDKYLVEIMYNYAKIEVMVDEKDIKDACIKAMVLLSSIYYNDDILVNLSNDTVLSYREEEVDIFETTGTDTSNFLEYVEEFDNIEENFVPDYDIIK